MRLGPVALTFAGIVIFEEIDNTGYSARVRAQGNDAKGRGSAQAKATFRLEPSAAGSKVLVHTDLTLSGAVAQYGRGVGMIQATASALMNQFANNLKKQLARSRRRRRAGGEADFRDFARRPGRVDCHQGQARREVLGDDRLGRQRPGHPGRCRRCRDRHRRQARRAQARTASTGRFRCWSATPETNSCCSGATRPSTTPADLWTNACCSHPLPGEPVADAARRRLSQEMGFACPIEPLFVYHYNEPVPGGLIENEVVHVFGGRHDGAIKPDPAEVGEWKWIGYPALIADMAARPDSLHGLVPALRRNARRHAGPVDDRALSPISFSASTLSDRHPEVPAFWRASKASNGPAVATAGRRPSRAALRAATSG